MKVLFPILAALALVVLCAPVARACDYGGGGVPASALMSFAPSYGVGCGVQAAPVFQQAPVVYQQRAFVQRSFVPARSFAPVGYGVGGAAFVPAGGGVNVNVNSGNVGRQRFLRR